MPVEKATMQPLPTITWSAAHGEPSQRRSPVVADYSIITQLRMSDIFAVEATMHKNDYPDAWSFPFLL